MVKPPPPDGETLLEEPLQFPPLVLFISPQPSQPDHIQIAPASLLLLLLLCLFFSASLSAPCLFFLLVIRSC